MKTSGVESINGDELWDHKPTSSQAKLQSVVQHRRDSSEGPFNVSVVTSQVLIISLEPVQDNSTEIGNRFSKVSSFLLR